VIRRAMRIPADPVTKCLMKADPTKLDEKCRSSDYFRSLVYHKLWRANRDRRIQGNFDKSSKKRPAGLDVGGPAENAEKPAAAPPVGDAAPPAGPADADKSQ
jgi:hypothetical protein